jgi:pimeloyl-ACP methyl ester carboxylesterase
MPPNTNLAIRAMGVRAGRLLLLAGAVHLALSAVAHPGDGLVLRSGRAELSSASPIETGRISVVFVHGLLGSPGNWSVMIDRLSAEPSVRARFQFLTFGYDSFQTIPDSGRDLLEALTEFRRRFDPDGLDDSFNRVVLVGHSLGGLVAKSAANVLGPSPAEADGSAPDSKGWSARPRIGRDIFVATPHRGAPIDRGVVRSAGAWIARGSSPSIASRQARGDEGALRSPTSVDQLTWDHPLLQELERSGAA